ncbi:MAG TPA: LacI family DNA-binding transcriptional regulator [bacterium]|nr:LacI family DNA-binding transcriptional regulator [bacterium]
MATIKDVAKQAGVTIGTVSRVLNNKKWVSEDCRKKVLVAIKDLHYKPQAHARRLRQKHSRICGVIAPHHTAIFRSPFFTDIMQGLEEIAAEHQYRLLIHPLNETARAQVSYRTLLGDGSVDGMFVLNAWSTDASIRELTEANVPFVLVNGKITAQEELPYVGFDNRGGVKKAIAHLVDLGHERIGIINGRMTTTNALERFQAFQEMLADHQLEFHSDWVADGDFEEEGGYKACLKILSAVRRPSAILCANDLMAIGAMRALKDKGLSVPEDMSIVGFDNMEEAAYHEPALTTVAFSAYEMGKLAAHKMFQMIAEEPLVEKATTLQAELIERQSTKKIN